MLPKDPQPRSLDLAGGHALAVSAEGGRDLVEIRARSGQVLLSIEITDRGPILRFEGASLSIQASGELSISADSLRLSSRNALDIQSGGDMTLSTPADLHTTARTQNIRADLGNINVRANDDVKLNGERVMVNC